MTIRFPSRSTVLFYTLLIIILSAIFHVGNVNVNVAIAAGLILFVWGLDALVADM